MDHKDLCEHTRIRLIAAAVGLQQCTKTASNIVPIPGGDRVIAIGARAQVRALLGAAPASGSELAFTNDGREPDWSAYAAAESAGDLPPLPDAWGTMYGNGEALEDRTGYTADQMRGYAIDVIARAPLPDDDTVHRLHKLREEVAIMYQMLDDGEWAEHIAVTPEGQNLETAITKLVGRANAAHAPLPAQGGDSVPATIAAGQEAANEKDAARWRKVLMHVGGCYCSEGVRFTLRGLPPIKDANIMKGSVAQHFTEAVDAAMAAVGAAGQEGGDHA
jgi:hypothetical protein